MSYPLKRVGDISDQIRGVTYKKQDASSEPGNGRLPVLRAGNITEHGITSTDLVYVPAEKVSTKQRVRRNDILIAASSGSIDVVGKAARSENDFEGGFGAFCKVLRPKKFVDPHYFAQFFKTKEYRRRVSFLAAGANINNLRNEDLDGLQIPLPPLEEQKRIAGILDAADRLRVQRRETLAQLDTLLQATFLELFGDPVTNPKGWEQATLGSLIEPDDKINYGVVQPGDDTPTGKPLIRVGDFVKGTLKLSGLKLIDPEIEKKYRRSRLNGSELLVSCVGSVGTVCKVPFEAAGFNIARAVSRIPLRKEISRDFMLHCLRSDAVQRHFLTAIRQNPLFDGLVSTKSARFLLKMFYKLLVISKSFQL